MKLEQLRQLVKEVIDEQTDDYEKFFKHMLNRTGYSLKDMSPKAKSKFFIAIDKAYKAKNEGKLRGYNEELKGDQEKIDANHNGEIDSDDFAKLRAGKKTNEEKPGLWANIRAKKARGQKSSPKNSDAYKDAVAAGKEINKK